MHNLEQKWPFLGQNNLIILGGSKIFGTHISENHQGTLFALFFGQAWNQMGQKGQYLVQNDQKCMCWAKFGRFWDKIQIFVVPTHQKTT